MDLFFGTTNPGKLRELRRLVADLAIRVVSPEDLGRPLPEVEEDGRTFAENAAKKAAAWARFSGLHALADDSGLCVDALGGAPGVHSARWSENDPAEGRGTRDELNNDKLLAALADVPDEGRGAEYQAVLTLARPDGTVVASVTGSCRGWIGRARRGTGGFGYDPLFVPEKGRGSEASISPRTMAELAPDEKDALSHRGDAFRRLRPVLERLVATLTRNPRNAT
jgi:XTP/dITP diphosphohydrolase